MSIKKNNITLILVAMFIISAILFVGWGAIKGLILNEELQMTPEQYGIQFIFAFGIMIDFELTYPGIQTAKTNNNWKRSAVLTLFL